MAKGQKPRFDEGEMAEMMELYDGTATSVRALVKHFNVSKMVITYAVNHKGCRDRLRQWDRVRHKLDPGRRKRIYLKKHYAIEPKKYMPLFVCDKCGCIENSALSACFWSAFLKKEPVYCSECCPEQDKWPGARLGWHGKFKKKKWTKRFKQKMMNR
jgi:hypothetical protein